MMDVHLRQDSSPSRQWVVELRKPGYCISLGRWPKDCQRPALTLANDVAVFLGVPLRISKTTEYTPSRAKKEASQE